MHYEIRHNRLGERTGCFATLKEAKIEAERLCNANDRKEHFEVLKIESVWVTSTLEEAIKQGK